MMFTGLHVPYTEIGHLRLSTFLTGLPDIYVMFQLSSAAYQLLLYLSVLVENIDLRKLNGLELHLKMDQSYSPIY